MGRICSVVMGVMSTHNQAEFMDSLNRRPGDQENVIFGSPDLLISCKAFFGRTNAHEHDDSSGDTGQ
jgi:hypothetical protein